VPVFKDAVRQAMVDIRIIRNHCLDLDDLPFHFRRAANVAMVGVIYCNGFAGSEGSKTYQDHQGGTNNVSFNK
jgi:hypothetical protein